MANVLPFAAAALVGTAVIGFGVQQLTTREAPKLILVDEQGKYKGSSLGLPPTEEAEQAAKALESKQNLSEPYPILGGDGQPIASYYLQQGQSPSSSSPLPLWGLAFLASTALAGVGFAISRQQDQELASLRANQWSGSNDPSTGDLMLGNFSPEDFMKARLELSETKEELEKVSRVSEVRLKKYNKAISAIAESKDELQTVKSELEQLKQTSETDRQSLQDQLDRLNEDLQGKQDEVIQLNSRLADARSGISQAMEERDQKSKEALQLVNDVSESRMQISKLSQEMQALKELSDRHESQKMKAAADLANAMADVDRINGEKAQLIEQYETELNSTRAMIEMLEQRAIAGGSAQAPTSDASAVLSSPEAVNEQLQLARMEMNEMNAKMLQASNQIQSLNRALRDKEIELDSARSEIYRLRASQNTMPT